MAVIVEAFGSEGKQDMKKMHVKVTYAEPLLGTASANPELHREFIAKKAPDAKGIEEEVAALGADAVEEKQMTVFHRTDDGGPCHFDYHWRGFFKEACSMLRRGDGFKSKDLKAFKKEIDGLIFVEPRKIPLVLPEGGEIGNLQRPLRASTAQGERIALANSETLPAGTVEEFDVMVLKDDLVPYVREWLAYGSLHGTGQWRNAGFGSFEVEVDGKPVSLF